MCGRVAPRQHAITSPEQITSTEKPGCLRNLLKNELHEEALLETPDTDCADPQDVLCDYGNLKSGTLTWKQLSTQSCFCS